MVWSVLRTEKEEKEEEGVRGVRGDSGSDGARGVRGEEGKNRGVAEGLGGIAMQHLDATCHCLYTREWVPLPKKALRDP